MISGVAPKAWLGSYKVLEADGSSGDDVIVKGVDDAAADGMDVITASINEMAQRFSDDTLADELQRLTTLGIIVVNSAGNGSAAAAGDDLNTIKSPSIAPSVISVGASTSDRIFYPASVTLPDNSLIGALVGDNSATA
jgi:hypothetical protein